MSPTSNYSHSLAFDSATWTMGTQRVQQNVYVTALLHLADPAHLASSIRK